MIQTMAVFVALLLGVLICLAAAVIAKALEHFEFFDRFDKKEETECLGCRFNKAGTCMRYLLKTDGLPGIMPCPGWRRAG